jgi:hypothetical protein
MKRLFAVFVLATLAGCATTSARFLDSEEGQLKLRSMQTRTFETTDKEKLMRGVISSMQDLGFVVEKADPLTGTVSGTKFAQGEVKLTVVVRPKDQESMLVRANAQHGLEPVTTPESYQDFFNVLSKSMFLQANAIN